eukprot:TRINITY_DN10180_c0_g1_i1.p1 TRINITY_DN10180_c0_g1~~TRINITY_DN10180_c0_g1_i1.p1  ORF type:complete len:466 (-),score=98.97 TRINITY_DN10180_c0_g1_i1:45-1442(-)
MVEVRTDLETIVAFLYNIEDFESQILEEWEDIPEDDCIGAIGQLLWELLASRNIESNEDIMKVLNTVKVIYEENDFENLVNVLNNYFILFSLLPDPLIESCRRYYSKKIIPHLQEENYNSLQYTDELYNEEMRQKWFESMDSIKSYGVDVEDHLKYSKLYVVLFRGVHYNNFFFPNLLSDEEKDGYFKNSFDHGTYSTFCINISDQEFGEVHDWDEKKLFINALKLSESFSNLKQSEQEKILQDYVNLRTKKTRKEFVERLKCVIPECEKEDIYFNPFISTSKFAFTAIQFACGNQSFHMDKNYVSQDKNGFVEMYLVPFNEYKSSVQDIPYLYGNGIKFDYQRMYGCEATFVGYIPKKYKVAHFPIYPSKQGKFTNNHNLKVQTSIHKAVYNLLEDSEIIPITVEPDGNIELFPVEVEEYINECRESEEKGKSPHVVHHHRAVSIKNENEQMGTSTPPSPLKPS